MAWPICPNPLRGYKKRLAPLGLHPGIAASARRIIFAMLLAETRLPAWTGEISAGSSPQSLRA